MDFFFHSLHSKNIDHDDDDDVIRLHCWNTVPNISFLSSFSLLFFKFHFNSIADLFQFNIIHE